MADHVKGCGEPGGGEADGLRTGRSRFTWGRRTNQDFSRPRQSSGQQAEVSNADGANSADARQEGSESKAATCTNKRVNWEHPYLGPDGVTYLPSISDASNPRATMIVSHSAAHPSYGPDPRLLQPEDIRFLTQAVTSLYADQIRPYQSEVVRRLKLFEPSTLVTKNALHFFRILTDIFIVEKTNHSRMVVYLKDKPSWFEGWIDPKSEEDPYPRSVWIELEDYLTVLSLVATILHELNSPNHMPPLQLDEDTSGDERYGDLPQSSSGVDPFTSVLLRKLRRLLRRGWQQDRSRRPVLAGSSGTRLSPALLEEKSQSSSVSVGCRSTFLEKACQQARLARPVTPSDAQGGSLTCTPEGTPKHSPHDDFLHSPPLPLSPKPQELRAAPSFNAMFAASPNFFLALAVAADEAIRFAATVDSSRCSQDANEVPTSAGTDRLPSSLSEAHQSHQNRSTVNERHRSSGIAGEQPCSSQSSPGSRVSTLSDRQLKQEQAISVLVRSVFLEAYNAAQVEDGERQGRLGENRETNGTGKQTQEENTGDAPATPIWPKPKTPAILSVAEKPGVSSGKESTGAWKGGELGGSEVQPSGDIHPPTEGESGLRGNTSTTYASSISQGLEHSRLGEAAGVRACGAPLEQAPTSLTSPCSSPSSVMSASPLTGPQNISSPPTCADVTAAAATALPIARGVALRIRIALAKGDAPDHFAGGRYGCALSLKRHGPVSVRSFTLGCLCHLVQLSVSRCLLQYAGGFLQPCASRLAAAWQNQHTPRDPMVLHATVAATAAAALAYLELLLQGEIPEGIEGLEGGEESDLEGSGLPPYLRLGEAAHVSQPVPNKGISGNRDESAEAQNRSGRPQGLTKIKTMAELRSLVTNVLACNQRAVLLSQLRGKLVDMYGATLTPSTFHYYKLSDLLLCELSDICSIWCHGDRQLVVHDAAYQPDPSTCASGQRPTKITAFSLSHPPSMLSGLHQSGSSFHCQQVYGGRDRGHGGAGDHRFKVGGSHPNLPTTAPTPYASVDESTTISEVKETVRMLRESGQHHQIGQWYRTSPGGRRYQIPDSSPARGKQQPFRSGVDARESLPDLPRLCLPSPKLQLDNKFEDEMPPRLFAFDTQKCKEELAGELLHLQLQQLQQRKPGPGRAEHQSDRILPQCTLPSRLLTPSSPCLFTSHQQKRAPEPTTSSSAGFLPIGGRGGDHAYDWLRETASAPDRDFMQNIADRSAALKAEAPASSLFSASYLLLEGLSSLVQEVAGEMRDTKVKGDLPGIRPQAGMQTGVSPWHERPSGLDSSARHGQSRSYTALPLSPSLRPVIAPPENIQCRWKSAPPDDIGLGMGRAASQPALWDRYGFDRADSHSTTNRGHEGLHYLYGRPSGPPSPIDVNRQAAQWAVPGTQNEIERSIFDMSETRTSFCLHIPPGRLDEISTGRAQQQFL
ncbi:hypothetical protein BESB_065510 [Besnoitia besnoiti]|uniref:HTH OST-type domain-containing protein n=1 Tax=Besnoitia besnoiti TaxID=94643 RepID=A0A2A9M9E1_BESBE|nr:hypothetical protein BESB_065510 [Besnoitia besnoiti]PFH34519.1 hypothetical protein BESB_065510 [Besnoitia besnoiti]